MLMRKATVVLMTVGILVGLGAAARALINPNFTPVHLVESSDLILVLKISPADDKGNCTAEIKTCLKGKKPDKPQIINLVNGNKEHGKVVKEIVAGLGDGPAMLFIGKDEKGAPASLLHLSGKWVTLDKAVNGENAWDVDVINSHMEATWAGGTDMLLKIVELLIKYPDTEVPVEGGARWDDQVQLGKIDGKVCSAQAVDVAGKGELWLFVACESGDRVYGFDRKQKKFEDLTAKLKLASKSRAAAWADFNGDGRLDLAAWDGQALSVWLQGADGAFAASAVADAPKGECLGLGALDVGVKGRAGLVWNCAGAPVVLVPDEDKAAVFTQKPLAVNAAAGKEQGPLGPCLIADLDGDGVADVLQIYAKGSVFFKGKGGGEFAEAKACAVGYGQGRNGAFLGDWDMDGRLDVFTLSEDACRLWQNQGDGKFIDMLGISGEIAYISKPGGIAGNVCDFNNDGRQDVFIAYSEQGPQCFFNRGFRSFGHAHKPIDLSESNVLPEACKGQQAGVVADLTGDGAQDMAVVLLNGEVWVFPRAVDGDAALSVSVALPLGGPTLGPVTVSAANDRRSLGAWLVAPGTSEAFLGRLDPGQVKLTWQLPGGKAEEKPFTLEDKPIRFVLPAGK